MGKILSTSSAILLLAMSFAQLGNAQDATTGTDTAAPAAEGADNTAQDAGTAEAPATSTPGQPVTRAQTPQEITAAVHGSWQIRCVTTEPRQCFLYQLIIDDRNTPLMEVTLLPAKDETGQDVKMVANIVTPLGVLLGRGLIMQVDNNDPVQRAFSWCAPQGCYSRFPVNGTELKQIQGGKKIAASIFMVQNPQQDLELTLPLDGFQSAYDDLMKMEAEQKK